MVESRVYVTIQRPLAEVWKFLMTAGNYPRWQMGVTAVQATHGMNEGSVLKIAMLSMGDRLEVTARIVENDGKSRYRAKTTRGPIAFTVYLQLSEVVSGTRVEMFSQINAHAVLKLAETALQEVSDTQNQTDLEKLKAIMEADDQPTGSTSEPKGQAVS